MKIEQKDKCSVVPQDLSLGPGIFEPFDSVFHHFGNSPFEIDILVKQIGQNTHLKRYYLDQDGKTKRAYFKSGQKLEVKAINLDLTNITFENRISYAFLCNRGSSDVGSFVYAIKKKGQYTTILWFVNGDLQDLSISDINKLGNSFDLLNLLKQY